MVTVKNQLRLRKKTGIILLILTGFFTSLHFTFLPNESKPISIYYKNQLDSLEKKTTALLQAVKEKADRKKLSFLFFQARVSYKKTAILSEFYNIYESKLLNGPPIPWADDDNPKQIFEPHGFQVIEEDIFGSDEKIPFATLEMELTGMLKTIQNLQKEKELDYKFSDELVFDALQSSVIRLITLGITGFDSPAALNSLPETQNTLDGLLEIITIYSPQFKQKYPEGYARITSLLQQSISYIKKNTSFNSFDRMVFIRQYISPIYAELTRFRIKSGFTDKGDRFPVNPVALSLFDTNSFNINSFSPTPRYRPFKIRVELGKKLFYDPILSATKTRHCGSCHKPELAFTDGLKTALAVDEKTYLLRNTPTLLYSALQRKQFFDSRTSVLENQLSDVVHNQEEMKGSLQESVKELLKDSTYLRLFTAAYSEDYEKITPYTIANAISSYMRSLMYFNSRFDKYMQGDTRQLTKTEIKGFNLFAGKAKCATCHFIPLFNGLVPPFFSESESEVLGVPATRNKEAAVLDTDKGRYLFTKSAVHLHAFKTPTLRNIERTAPYMHNGVYTTLNEVMEFYNNGGGEGLHIAPENQTLPPEKLNLTKKEITSIIAFMKTLTDTEIIQ